MAVSRGVVEGAVNRHVHTMELSSIMERKELVMLMDLKGMTLNEKGYTLNDSLYITFLK